MKPMKPQWLHGGGELLKVHRLDDEAVHAESVARDDIALLLRGGEYHLHGDRLGAQVALMRRRTSSPSTLGSLRSSRMGESRLTMLRSR